MSRAATSLFVFAIYLIGLGLILLLVPNFLFGLFGFPATSEIWIRVVGVLLLILAYYYILVSRAEFRPFMVATVYARASVIVFFAAFVLLNLAQPTLILFGAIDLLAAAWTWWALKQK